MRGYSIYLKSAINKMNSKNKNEVSKRLTPMERQAILISGVVFSLPIFITVISLLLN